MRGYLKDTGLEKEFQTKIPLIEREEEEGRFELGPGRDGSKTLVRSIHTSPTITTSGTEGEDPTGTSDVQRLPRRSSTDGPTESGSDW